MVKMGSEVRCLKLYVYTAVGNECLSRHFRRKVYEHSYKFAVLALPPCVATHTFKTMQAVCSKHTSIEQAKKLNGVEL